LNLSEKYQCKLMKVPKSLNVFICVQPCYES
jgi:hypothetical protein